MTRPDEYELVGMEQRARWLLDGVEIQRSEMQRREDMADCGKPRTRPTCSDYVRLDTQEAIAEDVLWLVRFFRQQRAVGGF
jgi:hypothetical protein